MAENDTGKTRLTPSTPAHGSTANVGTTNLALQRHPASATAALLTTLPSSVKSSLKIEERTTFPESGPTTTWLSCALTSTVPQLDLAQARSRIDASLAPLPESELLELLAELRALTRRQSDSGELFEMQIKTYRARLLRYPGDVVQHVLSQWPEVNQFWPSWAELVGLLQPLTVRREMLRDALLNVPAAR